jgi:hypothetical protein
MYPKPVESNDCDTYVYEKQYTVTLGSTSHQLCDHVLLPWSHLTTFCLLTKSEVTF